MFGYQLLGSIIGSLRSHSIYQVLGVFITRDNHHRTSQFYKVELDSIHNFKMTYMLRDFDSLYQTKLPQKSSICSYKRWYLDLSEKNTSMDFHYPTIKNCKT